MTIITEQSFQKKESYCRQANTQMDKWHQGLDRLEEELKEYPPQVQSAYDNELGRLRERWQNVKDSYTDMENSDKYSWEKSRYRWGESAAKYWQQFTNLANRIIDEREIPLGWVQGLTDKRTHESDGWAEGYNGHPSSSKGWAEGFGKEEVPSSGWAQGYPTEKS